MAEVNALGADDGPALGSSLGIPEGAEDGSPLVFVDGCNDEITLG